MSYLLNALLQGFIVFLFIVILLIVIFVIVLNIFKSKDKENIKFKNIKKIVVKLEKIVEDKKESLININDNTTKFYSVIKALNHIAENKNIEEVIIDVDNIKLNDIQIEELSLVFNKISKNKKLIAIGTSFDNHSYKIALMADKILMLDTKQSMIDIKGYNFKTPYIKKFLDIFGIKFNVIHIGDYKSAGENFSKDVMSNENRLSLEYIGNEMLEIFLENIKQKRNVDLKDKILNGELIYTSIEDAVNLNLIDGVFKYKDLKINYDEDTVSLLKYMSMYKKAKNKSKNIIGLINLEGEIKEKPSQNSILYNEVEEKVDTLLKEKNLKGVVLRINSPGGSALVSEMILQKLKEIQVPIYVSMSEYCASGGYYISTIGKKVFANKSTITGSIGVVVMYPEIKDTMDKCNINIEQVSKGKGHDIFNVFTPLTNEAKEKIIKTMDIVYSEFKNHVLKARNIDSNKIEEIAQGRIWLGESSKNHNLIDEIGGLNDTIESLVNDLNLKDYKIIEASIEKEISDYIPNALSFLSMEIQNYFDFINNMSGKVMMYETFKK